MLFPEGAKCKTCGKVLAGRGLVGHEYCSIHYIEGVAAEKIETPVKKVDPPLPKPQETSSILYDDCDFDE